MEKIIQHIKQNEEILNKLILSDSLTETKKIIDSSDFVDLLGKRFREVEYQKARQSQVKKLAKNIETTYKSLINDLTEKIEIVDIQ